MKQQGSEPPSASQSPWPEINLVMVEGDNAKMVLERADALLKAQQDALRAMEARIAGLLGQSVTLSSAAVAIAATALATTGRTDTPLWLREWMVPGLIVLAVFWLSAAVTAARSMEAKPYAVPGTAPRFLYDPRILAADTVAVRLMIARSLQGSIEANELILDRFAQRLTWIVRLLATGPVAAACAALWVVLPSWRLIALALVLLLANVWLVCRDAMPKQG